MTGRKKVRISNFAKLKSGKRKSSKQKKTRQTKTSKTIIRKADSNTKISQCNVTYESKSHNRIDKTRLRGTRRGYRWEKTEKREWWKKAKLLGLVSKTKKIMADQTDQNIREELKKYENVKSAEWGKDQQRINENVAAVIVERVVK